VSRIFTLTEKKIYEEPFSEGSPKGVVNEGGGGLQYSVGEKGGFELLKESRALANEKGTLSHRKGTVPGPSRKPRYHKAPGGRGSHNLTKEIGFQQGKILSQRIENRPK